MAELKSVIRHLLNSELTLESTIHQADLFLTRQGVLATAQIVEIDTARQKLRYLNAGHPYPILRPCDGPPVLLTEGHRPMLGLGTETSDVTAADVPLTAGDLLLLYTDGLIERRTRHIQQCMSDLMSAVSTIQEHSMSDLLDQVLAICSTFENRADDDIALIAVRCL